MRRSYSLLFALLATLLLAPSLHSQVSTYRFTAGSGAEVTMSSPSSVFIGTSGGGYKYNEMSAELPIGFNFVFNNVTYTTFKVSTNGQVTLGSGGSASPSNQLTGSSSYPLIAPFWDDMRVSGGVQGCGNPAIRYETANGVLTIDFRDIDLVSFSPRWGSFQVRLYQSSNKIEFYYKEMNPCDACGRGYGCSGTSASIGIAASASDYISVTPSGGSSASASSSAVNNNVNVNSNGIGDGTVFSFLPCKFDLAGLTGPNNGGTALLNNGDTFFSGNFVQTGQSRTFTPFYAYMSAPECSGNFTMTISGPAAADYYFNTPGTQSVTRSVNNGLRDSAKITFRPSASGVRSATLTVTGPNFSRTFNLAAAAPRINYTGIPAEGGTVNMRGGDTLLVGKSVPRLSSQTYTPFSILNIGSPAPVRVTFTINDPSGQYRIAPTDTLLSSGNTALPRLTFSPTSVGIQYATLTVNTQDEIRTFVLAAYAAAPGGLLFTNNGTTLLDSNSTLFSNQFSCAGEGIISYPITVNNIGDGDFVVNSIDVFLTDTVYQQGTPRYPFLRDDNGRLIRSDEYFLSESPAVSPRAANAPMSFPLVVPDNGSRTIYLTFISREPGKRFARVYINTNGQNFSYNDTTGQPTLGVLTFDLFGRGTGSVLTDAGLKGLPRTVVFPTTPVGDSSTAWLHLRNPGTCDLRISEDYFRIFAGDVEEFRIVSIPASISRDALTGDLLLPAGFGDSIQLRFTPRHIGSRRATLWMKTNDSTVQVPGLTERGSYYLDLFGEGSQGLYAEALDLGVSLIGGTSISQGVVRISNATADGMTITGLTIAGANAADFSEDAAAKWPVTPFVLESGQTLDLSVVFTPTGTAGGRSAMLTITTANGETVNAQLTGEAATRTVTATPAAVNFGSLSVGKTARKTVEIRNNGTMPLRLSSVKLSGADSAMFSLGSLPRLELVPGQVELLEVSYTPTSAGAKTAVLTIASDATGGDVVVQLNGVASKARFVGEDPTGITQSGNGGGELPDQDVEQSVSEVTGEVTVGGVSLSAVVPNPAREVAEIVYRLSRGGTVELGLYNSDGKLVRILESGEQGIGEHHVRVELSGLSSGVYHYRLLVNGNSLSRSMTVTK